MRKEEETPRHGSDTQRILGTPLRKVVGNPPWNVTAGRLEQERRLAVANPRGQNVAGPTCQAPPHDRGMMTERREPGHEERGGKARAGGARDINRHGWATDVVGSLGGTKEPFVWDLIRDRERRTSDRRVGFLEALAHRAGLCCATPEDRRRSRILLLRSAALRGRSIHPDRRSALPVSARCF